MPSRRLGKRAFGFAIIAAAVAAYAAVLIWLVANEDALLFRPDKGSRGVPPAWLQLDSRDVGFASVDGTSLTARLIDPPVDADRARAPWILYFHGASGNVSTLGYNEAWAKFRSLGLGVLAVDYRGYGNSGGVPSEAGLYRDADAAYAYLVENLRVAPSRILIYGYSLGSAVAIDLAARLPAAGMMVEGAFTSVADRGADLYPYVPVRWLVRNRFASIEKIARVSMPKLLIHARGDTVVPIAHGRTLFAAAREPKQFEAVAGGHTDAHQVDPRFFAAISRFIAALGLEVRASGRSAAGAM